METGFQGVLESGPRWAASACILTLALLAVSVTATADLGAAPAPDAPQPSAESVQAQAAQAKAEAFATVQDAKETAQAQLPNGGSPPPPSQPHPIAAPVPAQAVGAVDEALKPVRALLPSDPIGLVKSTADDAGRIPASILQPAQADEPAQTATTPQGAMAEPAAPSLLAPGLIIAAGAATAATFLGFWLAGSSGAVGSKAAAAAAAKADLRRLLPFASPLFTRFERDTVLGHPRREALYALILQEPGISLQSLGDATGLSRTAVIHHLRLMEQQHLVVSRRVGRSRHYFENGGRYGHDQKEAYAILQNGRSKAVAEFIKGHPGAMQKMLCEALGIQPSIAHWHVRRLEEAHIVETVRQGRTVAYFPGPGLVAMDATAASQSSAAPTATA